jgi:tRNA threonylcarbamoyladenosine biosynthesis protein TsaB
MIAMPMDAKLLLIDTCGVDAGVALVQGSTIRDERSLSQRSSSAEIVTMVRELLQQAEWAVSDLAAVGVVTGPGSFTGVRIGLAVAKGLCEATGLPMAAVSRLEVLTDVSGLQHGFIVLDAGRGELYVRDAQSGRESLTNVVAFSGLTAGKRVVVAEQKIAALLADLTPVLYPLKVALSLSAVRRQLANGGTDASLSEANYVRSEGDIYAKAQL